MTRDTQTDAATTPVTGTNRRMFFLVMGVAAIAIFAKAGLLWEDASLIIAARAQAQENAAEQVDATSAAPATEATQTATPATLPPPPSQVSRSEMDLLQELSVRREELAKREEEVELREQLLAATEKRIDGKIGELRTIEERIQALLVQYEEQENAQLANIVKVYETMKPKDAADIFQRLDMQIQIDVAQRMKSSKMAAVLASMDPEKARDLTAELATRSQLPIEQALRGEGGN